MSTNVDIAELSVKFRWQNLSDTELTVSRDGIGRGSYDSSYKGYKQSKAASK